MASAIATEHHSIDFIPLNERYGSPRRLFTLWFSCNLHILGVAAGVLSITSGLSLVWALVAIALGNALGTVIMAAHSAQGPQLGVPQMIQSRAQFGVIGAGLPLLAVIVTYVLYSAADGLVIQGTLRSLLPVGDDWALILFALATLIVAYVGYELIHRVGKIMTLLSTGLFASAAVLMFIHPLPGGTLHPPLGHFAGAAFVLAMTQAAAWSLSYGPYVADYSRYLPADTPPARTFWATALGCFFGSTLIMAFGAYLAYQSPTLAASPSDAVAGLFGSGRQIAEWLLVMGVTYGNVMNLYSAYMSTCTVVSGFNRMTRVGGSFKLAVMTGVMIASTVIAVASQRNFQSYFSDILSAMIYLLVPWSAINLADYYLVRKGSYDIEALFHVHGLYKAYRWRTIAVFLLGVAAEEPFMSLTFHSGVLAQRIGADIAWAPGVLIPALLYVLIERGRSPAPAIAAGSVGGYRPKP